MNGGNEDEFATAGERQGNDGRTKDVGFRPEGEEAMDETTNWLV